MTTATPIPAYVPSHLVRPFDYVTSPGMDVDPYRTLHQLHLEGPAVFWNPLNTRHDGRGTWDITKAAHMREILGDQTTFSSRNCAGFAGMIGEEWLLTPLEIDPPDHGFYRTFLNPLVSPVAVKKMDDRIQQRVQELLDKVKHDGGCEFMGDFARPFPVTIIMQLLGLPMEEFPTFVGWGYKLLHSPAMQDKIDAATEIRDYLVARIAEKRRNPQDDFISYVCTHAHEGRRLTEAEAMGICYLMFVGGLDTVAASLGFHFHHLATHHGQQQYLRDNPNKIPVAVEELLRRFSVVMTARHVTRDIDFHGITMKKGDWITLPQALSSVDPDEFEDPLTVKFDRHGRHLAFSFGPHFCMGNHIGRREMIVALQKWTSQIPMFSVKPGAPFTVHGGGVFGIEYMELQW